MEGKNWETYSATDDDDDGVIEVDLLDKDDEEHKAEFSKAFWVEELGMAEVVVKKGKMWTTTGINRGGKTYCLIEEALYLSEIGALQLLEEGGDVMIPLNGLYQKVAEGKSGCVWKHFEVYRYLKGLGYVVGRHSVPWSVKGATVDSVSSSLQEDSGTDGAPELQEEDSVIKLLSELQIREARPVFDVYLPNSRFKKSAPGNPSFVACFTGGSPPSKTEIQMLQRRIAIPLMFCHVEHGRVSFFSFNKVDLPVLP